MFEGLIESGDSILIDGPERYILAQMGEVIPIFRMQVPHLEDLIKVSFFESALAGEEMRVFQLKFLIFSEFARCSICYLLHQRCCTLNTDFYCHRICEREDELFLDWARWFMNVSRYFNPCVVSFKRECVQHFKKIKALVVEQYTTTP